MFPLANRGLFLAKLFCSAQGIVLLLEALALVMLLFSLAVSFVEFWAFAFLMAVLSLAYIFVLFSGRLGKRFFGRDFRAHAVFFVFLFCVVQLAWAGRIVFAGNIDAAAVFFAVLLGLVLGFSFLFGARFGKKQVEATVVSVSGKTAIVESDFDFLARSNKAIFRVAAKKGMKKGKKLKLKLKRRLWKTTAEITD